MPKHRTVSETASDVLIAIISLSQSVRFNLPFARFASSSLHRSGFRPTIGERDG